MGQQLENRKWRLEHAALHKNMRQQWGLINAAVEEANTNVHKLEVKEAANMRGRLKSAYQTCEKSLLKCAELVASKE